MTSIPVSDDSFDSDVLKAEGSVLVDFWAEWCGPCKMISPALEDVFIPHREEVFERYLSQMACVDCEDPGLSTSDQPVPIPVPLSADGTSPAWLSPDEVGRIDAERKQGLLVETLGGPRRVH